ncbi:MAG: pyruvate kinase, partial [Planctomycetota bacterium]
IRDVKAGDRVLLDDGNVILKVVSKSRGAARCRVEAGGAVSDNKGINLPGVALSVPSVTEKDIKDLEWAAEVGADYVAVSFVRRAGDIVDVRSRLHRLASGLQVIAKIEKPEALERIDDIARVSDGLMVARGDLGVEMPLEDVPVAQGRIIAAAHKNDIPVIVATQMLESMTSKPRPTRAEVSDVAGAIFGGTDAVMLSGETAVGRFPVKAVEQMAAIAGAAEDHLEETGGFAPVLSTSAVYAIADAVCHGAYSAARDLGAKAVFISTTSGRTALLFSKYRFPGVLVGASDDEAAVRRMALYWGVRPIRVPTCDDHHRLLGEIVGVALKKNFVSSGEMVIFLAGSPLGKTGATNLLIVHRVAPRRAPSGRDTVRARVGGGGLQVDRRLCILCGACVGICPVSIYTIEDDRIRFRRENLKRCLGDWRCRDICPVRAIKATPSKRKGKGR